MIYLVIFLIGVAAGSFIGWRLGWNACALLYRDRTIEGAHQRYEQDRR